MTLALSQDTLDYYAREADRKARGMQAYGGNPELVKLRCFKYYHPDSGSWLTNPEGLAKWVGPKTARIFAILDRSASGSSRMTMSAISSEALCSTSTVSRAIVKLQAFGFLVADVKRGRNGGVTVRMRRSGDGLKHYAAAAWRRIRAWINVASTFQGREGDPKLVTSNTSTHMDATFSEAARIERDGARILAGEISVEEAIGPSRRPTEADREWARAEQFARDVIRERRLLDERDPDWDRYLELVRASHGLG